MNKKDKVVAIDGPAGSGKSSVAKKIATMMSFNHIDTGAMFRAIGLYFYDQGIALERLQNESFLERQLKNLDFSYRNQQSLIIQIDKHQYSDEIRQHFVSELASGVSKLPLIRNFLLEKQRQLVANEFCVMEGRDIGTVVFPHAFIKFFLTASSQERARRRLAELNPNVSSTPDLEAMIKDIEQRDKSDSERAIAPLKQAQDAIRVDTTHMTFEEVVTKLKDEIISQKKVCYDR